jgi:holliday junction DNA helicase RuvA
MAMIGRIRGVLIEKQAPALLVDIAGVGYNVQASMNTFYRLPAIGKEVILHTHFVVREDAQQLYGFLDLSERALFRALIKVSGIGPRTALSILSSIEPDAFAQCVVSQDTTSLSRLPGIGKKTAERLIIEMRDHLSKWQDSQLLQNKTGQNNPEQIADMLGGRSLSPMQDAISGLIALGYKPQEASRLVLQLGMPEDTDSSELIRLVLKNMMKT